MCKFYKLNEKSFQILALAIIPIYITFNDIE